MKQTSQLGSSDTWWEKSKGSPLVHLDALTRAAQYEADACSRRLDDLVYYRLFSGRALPSLYGMAMTSGGGAFWVDPSQFVAPKFNLVRVCTETLVSKVGRNRPWIMWLTDGGNWKSRFVGKRLTQYTQGLFHETETYRHGRMAIQDCLIAGTGIVKVFSEGDRICVERVLPDELLVDESEAIYGQPRTLYQRRFVHRSRLLALYGAKEGPVRQAIVDADCAVQGVMSLPLSRYGDMIPVVEAWHLPDGDDGKGGRHVVCIEGATLVDEPWKRDRFPFAIIRYNTLHSGFWGQGIGEILWPIQEKIDRTDAVIDEAQMRVGRPWLSAPKTAAGTSGMTVSKLVARGIANVIEHMPGCAPQVMTFPSVAGDVYNERSQLIEYGFQFVGISQLAASGMRQPGLNSGEAIRAQHDYESERFVSFAQQIEEFYADVAVLMVEEAKETRPKVRVPGRGMIEVMPWSAVETDFQKSKCVPTPFPLSSFPTFPPARLARADEMLGRGQISKEQHARIMNYPDVQADLDLITAPRDLVDKTLDSIVENGDEGYRAPEPGMDLELCVSIGTLRYNYEMKEGTPEDRLDLISRFVAQSKALRLRLAAREQSMQQQAQPPAAAAAPIGSVGSEAQTVNPAVPSQVPVQPASAMMPAA